MEESVSAVLSISQRLESLQRRMTELDVERAHVQQEIAGCMRELAAMADRGAAPPPGALPRQHILWVLRQNPNRPMGPIDVAIKLRVTSRHDEANVRTLLARMAKEGTVKRVSHGRYIINEG